MNGFAFDGPIPLAMMESSNGRGRTYQDRVLPHLRQKLGAQRVAPDPGVKKIVATKLRLIGRPLEELREYGTSILLAPWEHRIDQHSPDLHEKFPPQFTSLLQSLRTERRNLESCVAQRCRRSPNCLSNFRHYGSSPVVVEISDARAFQFLLARPAKRHGRGAGVTLVRTLHDL